MTGRRRDAPESGSASLERHTRSKASPLTVDQSSEGARASWTFAVAALSMSEANAAGFFSGP